MSLWNSQEGEQYPSLLPPPAFVRGTLVKFTRRFGYGQDWIDQGHLYGRVEGVHHYGHYWVYDLQKMAPDEYTGDLRYVGTPAHGVKIYMVPEWALETFP